MEAVPFRDGVIGHGAILRLLEAWLQRPRSGYLFSGPAHVGKRTVAERFVQRLLEDAAPALRRAHPDLIVLEPLEGKRMISVEAVRDVKMRLSQRPAMAPRMVVYVPAADRLQEEGMNAFLKMIEEPPAGAVFVFVLEDPSALPATIHSRMVPVPFSLVPRAEIVAGLVARGMAAGEAERLAGESRGRPGFALEPSAVAQASATSEFRRFMDASRMGVQLEIADRLGKQCEDTEDPLEAWNGLLDGWIEECRRALADQPETALVLGRALVTAKRFVGGPLSPRLALDAGALALARVREERKPVGAFFFQPYRFSSLPIQFS